jgi:hypothetical protein
MDEFTSNNNNNKGF